MEELERLRSAALQKMSQSAIEESALAEQRIARIEQYAVEHLPHWVRVISEVTRTGHGGFNFVPRYDTYGLFRRRSVMRWEQPNPPRPLPVELDFLTTEFVKNVLAPDTHWRVATSMFEESYQRYSYSVTEKLGPPFEVLILGTFGTLRC